MRSPVTTTSQATVVTEKKSRWREQHATVADTHFLEIMSGFA
jgi:hypothetical protein